jgi:hypothetical protein
VSAVLDRLEAQGAIADLVHAYALAIRREAYEDVAGLFAPGGTFEVHSGQPNEAETTPRQIYASVDELVAFLVAGRGRPGPVPLVHNLVIEVDGDTASANAVMIARILGTGDEILGEYFDRFLRVDGRWLFAGRKYVVWG